jgi:hypothetical protein
MPFPSPVSPEDHLQLYLGHLVLRNIHRAWSSAASAMPLTPEFVCKTGLSGGANGTVVKTVESRVIPSSAIVLRILTGHLRG